jgi:hypothetical protein
MKPSHKEPPEDLLDGLGVQGRQGEKLAVFREDPVADQAMGMGIEVCGIGT